MWKHLTASYCFVLQNTICKIKFDLKFDLIIRMGMAQKAEAAFNFDIQRGRLNAK